MKEGCVTTSPAASVCQRDFLAEQINTSFTSAGSLVLFAADVVFRLDVDNVFNIARRFAAKDAESPRDARARRARSDRKSTFASSATLGG